MSEVVAETRQLKMHRKLLLDVIQRQAGTLDKAMLEGGMNAMEAIVALEANGGVCKDKKIYMTYTKLDGNITITIQDFGKGITTEKEIEEFFETFGTPHDESEHKVFAQFRMGRGQMFNFGKNVWRTGTFELTVDVLNKGLEWELKKNLPFVDGCHITIELYDKYINQWPAHTEDCFKDSVKRQMEFIELPLIFNGEQINTPAQDCTWDFEDEFAYYLFNVGDKLATFNLGVFVEESWQAKGIVVSKQQLKLNFPRNNVMADCVIFHHIKEVVRKNTIEKAKKSYTALTKNERRGILKDVRDGSQSYEDARTIRILQTAQDKYLSLSMFLNSPLHWTIATIGNNQADRLIQQGSHVVFAREMLDALNYSGEDKNFFDWLMNTQYEINRVYDDEYRQYNSWRLDCDADELKSKKQMFEPFNNAARNINSNVTIITKTTKVEKRLIYVLEGFDCWNGRKIRIGTSAGSAAWTDGGLFINLDRNWLKRLNLHNDFDVAELFGVMAHEITHHDDTSRMDIHDEDFYENFHDTILFKGRNNPFGYMVSFKEKMRNALLAEQREQTKKREKAELDKKTAKLLGK